MKNQREDYIEVYENKLTPETCNAIINFFNQNALWDTSTFSNDKENTGATSKVDMNEYWITNKDQYYDVLSKTFKSAVDKYIKVHTRITPTAYTAFRLNHYAEGGFMKNHVDNIYRSHGQQYGYPHLTSLLFLNDNYEGGEFVMLDDTYKAKVKQGSVIVFPSNFMYDHEVKKVTKGNRYSVMTWIM